MNQTEFDTIVEQNYGLMNSGEPGGMHSLEESMGGTGGRTDTGSSVASYWFEFDPRDGKINRFSLKEGRLGDDRVRGVYFIKFKLLDGLKTEMFDVRSDKGALIPIENDPDISEYAVRVLHASRERYNEEMVKMAERYRVA
jgi:hypothetical protein